MSQRQLNVRVTSQVDKSLTDLLNKLEKYSKTPLNIKTKVVTDDKDFTSFLNKVKSVSDKHINVRTSVDLKHLEQLDTKLVKVTRGNKTVNVPVKVVSESALDRLQGKITKISHTPTKVNVTEHGVAEVTNKLDTVDSKIKSLTGTTHKVRFAGEGLGDLIKGLDNVAGKVVSFASQGAVSVGKAIASNVGELYDSQVGFSTQASELGLDSNDINKALTELGEFGAQSKYTIADLNNLGIALKGAGFDEEFGGFVGLTKNLANLSSLAPNSAAALKRVATQVKQMTLEGKVYSKDWNAIRDNIGGYASQKVLDAFKVRGINDLPDALSHGEVNGREFIEVLNEVGQDKTLQEMATQTNTLSSAWDNLVESLTYGLTGTLTNEGALSPLIDDIIKLMNTVQDATPIIAGAVSEWVTWFRKLIKENLGDFSFQKFFEGFKEGIKPLNILIEYLIKFIGVVSGKGANLGNLTGWILTLSTLWLTMRKGQGIIKSLLPLFGTFSQGLSGLFSSSKGGGASAGGGKMGNPLGGLNFQGLVNSLSGAVTMISAVGTLKLLASALKDIENLNLTENTLKNLEVMAGVLAGAILYIGFIGFVLEKIEDAKKYLITGGIAVLGVTGGLLLICKAFEAMNQMDIGSFGEVASKLGTMAFALGASIIAFGLLGFLLTGVPEIAVLIAIGELAMLEVAETLVLLTGAMVLVARGMEDVAQTIQRINEIDLPSWEEFGAKMLNLTALVVEMSASNFVNGIASAVGGISSLMGAMGNLAQVIYLDTVIELVNKIKEVIKIADTIPDEGAMLSAKKKLTSLMNFFQGDGGLQDVTEPKGWDVLVIFDNLGDFFANKTGTLSLDSFIEQVTKISNFITMLQKLEIPKDITPIKNKIESLNKVMEELSNISQEIGKSRPTGSSTGGSSAYTSNLTEEFENIISAVETVSEFAKKVQGMDVPLVELINPKLEKIKKVMTYIQEEFNQKKNWFDFNWGNSTYAGNKAKEIKSLIDSIKSIIEGINKIQELPIDDSIVEAIKSKLGHISNVFKGIEETLSDEKFKIPDDFSEKIEKLSTMIGSVTKVFDEIKGIAESDITSIIESIKNNLGAIAGLADNEIFKKDLFTEDLTKLSDNLYSFVIDIKGIGTRLKAIEEIGEIGDLTTIIGNISSGIVDLASDDLHTALNKFTDIKSTLELTSKVNDLVIGLKDIAENLDKLPAIDAEIVVKRIGYIKEALEALTDTKFTEALNKLRNYTKQFDNVKDITSDLKSISTSLNNLEDINMNNVPTKVGYIQTALEAIQKLLPMIEIIGNTSSKSSDAKTTITNIKTLTETLIGFPSLEGSTVGDTITSLNKILYDIAIGLNSNISLVATMGEKVGTAKGVVEAVVQLTNTIIGFPAVDEATILGYVNSVKNIIEAMTGISADDKVIGNLTTIITKFQDIKTAISDLATSAKGEGVSAGSSYAEGFTGTEGLGTKLTDALNKQIEAIKELAWTDTGKTVAGDLASGFKSGLGNKLADAVDSQRRAIENLGWYSTGSTISTKLADGFKVSGILNKISEIQSAINSLQGKTIEITTNHTTLERTVKRQHGGIIPEYHSTGGVVGRGWKQSGTDTVPAMLTAGEYVLKRSVTSALGTQFLQALNDMNLTTALRHLQNKAGNTITNNNYTITQNVDNKSSFLNGLTELRGVVRP